MLLHLIFLFPTRCADSKTSLMQISPPACRSLAEELSMYRDAFRSQEPKIRLLMPQSAPESWPDFQKWGDISQPAPCMASTSMAAVSLQQLWISFLNLVLYLSGWSAAQEDATHAKPNCPLTTELTCRAYASNLFTQLASSKFFPPVKMSGHPFQVLHLSNFAHAFIQLIMA